MASKSLSVKVIFELRPETREGWNPASLWKKRTPGRWKRKCKGPEAGARSVRLRTSKAVSVAAAGLHAREGMKLGRAARARAPKASKPS